MTIFARLELRSIFKFCFKILFFPTYFERCKGVKTNYEKKLLYIYPLCMFPFDDHPHVQAELREELQAPVEECCGAPCILPLADTWQVSKGQTDILQDGI